MKKKCVTTDDAIYDDHERPSSSSRPGSGGDVGGIDHKDELAEEEEQEKTGAAVERTNILSLTRSL